MSQQEEFKAKLHSSVDAKFCEIIAQKPEGKKHLTYTDAIILTTAVRNIFKNKLKICPPQIEVSCDLSEALLAPTTQERIKRIKAAVALGGGLAGIILIISGIAAALGWGASAVALVIAFFTGAPMIGPVGWIAAGAAITAVAGYFALTGSPQKDTERFRAALKAGLNGAVDAIWPEHGETLSAD